MLFRSGQRTALNPWVQLKTAARAMELLFIRLGPVQAALVCLDVAVDQLAGRPFGHLPPPLDDREASSRAQAGPAILLYGALRRRMHPDRALALTREVVVAGAVIFLSTSVGPLDRHTLSSLSRAELESFAKTIAGRFFNAELRWDEISGKAVRFTVTHCLFPDLCRAAGVPEIAPLLCEGDAVYFGEVLGTVDLTRSQTIASGGRNCPFELRWKNP